MCIAPAWKLMIEFHFVAAISTKYWSVFMLLISTNKIWMDSLSSKPRLFISTPTPFEISVQKFSFNYFLLTFGQRSWYEFSDQARTQYSQLIEKILFVPSFRDMTFDLSHFEHFRNNLTQPILSCFIISLLHFPLTEVPLYKSRTFPNIQNTSFLFVQNSAYFYWFRVRIIQNVDAIRDGAIGWIAKFRYIPRWVIILLQCGNILTSSESAIRMSGGKEPRNLQ